MAFALMVMFGIPRTTLVRYLELLSSVFLIKSIPAWSSWLTHRAVGTPKLAFVDTGVACHLIGQDERGRLYRYRAKDKVEVDAVIETPTAGSSELR